MSASLRVFAPATVANVACGFDILGFALEQPGDELTMYYHGDQSGIRIENHSDIADMPLDPTRNTLGVSLQAFCDALGHSGGFEIHLTRKVRPGSGIGSSSASAAASVFAANELLGRPYDRHQLVAFAMEGERAACGTAHADNVAPALMGGFVLVRSYKPLEVVALDYPEELYCAVVHPQIELKTADARRVLRRDIPLRSAVVQWGNIAGLVAGLYKKDYGLIGRSLEDVVVEPMRSVLIPGYAQAKAAAMEAGALGASISGSGPSLFALTASRSVAEAVSVAVEAAFAALDIPSIGYVSSINGTGARVLE
ncbi:MAG: homoserine kinase [Bernardetiaceae bacterium]